MQKKAQFLSMAVGIGALASCFFGTSDAHAKGYYHIPGSLCQPAKADVGVISPSSKGVYNDKTAPAKVYCPLTFDALNLWTTPDKTVQIAVTYFDLNGGTNTAGTLDKEIWCVLNMYDDNNLLVTSTQISSGSNTTSKNFVWTLDMNVIDRGSRSNSWSVTCTLPAAVGSSRSSIHSLLVLAL